MGLLLAVIGFAGRADAATAVCSASELCAPSANPCTISGTRDVASGCALDFGARSVVLTGALQAASPGGSFAVKAGALTLSAGKIRSTGPSGVAGGNVTIEVAGALVLTGSGPTLDVSGGAGGGILNVTAGSIAVQSGSVAADGSGSEACGGAITLRATSGPLTLAAPVHATGHFLCAGGQLDLSGNDVVISSTLNVSGGDYPGGITVTANTGDVTVTGSGTLRANGEQVELGDGGDGGPIALLAESGDVTIDGAIVTEGASPEGEAGSIVVVAAGFVDVGATLSAQGNGGGSNGGTIEIDAGGDVAFGANARVNGGSDAAAGEIDVRSDGVVTVAAGKLLQANGGFFGGGAITLRDASRIEVAGTLEARGSTGNGGFTTLESCRATVSGTLDTSAGAGGLSGANAIRAGVITVAAGGRLLATPCNPLVGASCNLLSLTAGAPAIDPLAVATPPPIVAVDPGLGTCCGNSTLEPGETCDDGNALGCDGCSHLCQVEASPPCPSDGNECTSDCSPTAGCVFTPRTGESCSDDGNACTSDVCNGGGACVHPPRVCNDGIACTSDACVAGVGCVATPDDARCDDGESCTQDVCEVGTGCTHAAAPDGTTCDDANVCTTDDRCAGGVCTPHGPDVRCDDDDACTTDACLPTIGCHFTEHPELCPCAGPSGPAAAGSACADGNDCSPDDVCDGAGNCVGGEVCPDDGDACTAEMCVTMGKSQQEICLALDVACTTDCAGQPDGTPCSDGSACTTGACAGGACVATPVPCGDGDVCTGADYCLTTIGCRSGAPPLDAPACEAPSEGPDAFLCYVARPDRAGPRFEPLLGVAIEDRFGSARADVRKPANLCLPVNVDGDDPTAPAHPDVLGGYVVRLRDVVPSGTARTNLAVSTVLGDARVDVKKIDGALVPSAMSTTTPPGPPLPPDPDRFACYKATSTPGATKFMPVFAVALADALGTLTVDVVRPTRVCTPLAFGADDAAGSTSGQPLLCFKVRTSSGTPRFAPRGDLHVANELGALLLDLRTLDELCLPATIQ